MGNIKLRPGCIDRGIVRSRLKFDILVKTKCLSLISILLYIHYSSQNGIYCTLHIGSVHAYQ